MRIKRLIRNINMLNVALLTGALLFASYFFFPSLDITAGFTLPAVNKSAAEKEETGTEIRIPSVTEYVKISEENLFHPERKIPVEKKADQQQQPLSKPEFVLYGTLITDDLRLAYIEDLKAPRNSPGRGKRQTALKKGDALSGFTLKEIEADQIVMARGEESIAVKVLGDTAKKERSIQTTPQAKEAPPAMPARKPGDISRKRLPPKQPK
ncbi:MAG: hypothetical protein WC769_00830 [Thermodesulfovibrionales bacterium]|jgi:hypothetical protein